MTRRAESRDEQRVPRVSPVEDFGGVKPVSYRRVEMASRNAERVEAGKNDKV